MTVRSADLTVFSNWLKDQYYGPEPEMLATFNTTSYFMNEELFNRNIEVNEDGGNQFVYFLRSGWPTGFGSRSEYTGTAASGLPDARAGTFRRITGTMKNHYMTYRFTGPGQARTRSNVYSFADLKKDGLTTVPLAFSKFMSQMCHRDGSDVGSGALARVNGDPSAGTTLTVDGNMTTGSGATFGTSHFHEQMEVSFYNDDGAAAPDGDGNAPGGATLTKIDTDTSTHRTAAANAIITGITSNTVATAVLASDGTSNMHADIADNDYVTWSQPSTAWPQEATGLLAHLSTLAYTVHGQNKSTATWFQPAFSTGTIGDDTAFSLTHLDTDVTSLVHTRGPDVTTRLVLIMDPLLANRVAREMKDLTRFESDDFDMKWGFRTISYVQWGTRATVVVDNDSSDGTILYLTPGAFAWHQTGDPHIAKDDGLTIRWISGFDAWEFMYRWISEFVCYQPKACGIHRGFVRT